MEINQISIETMGKVFIPNMHKKKRLDNIINQIQEKFCELNLPEYFYSNLKFATTEAEILETMQLRSRAYTKLGYNRQFPEEINGLNYDDFDRNSLILISKFNEKITGTLRIVYDSIINLPSEKMIELNNLRKKYRLAELSRLIVDPEFRSGNRENGSMPFNNLFAGTYWTFHLTHLNKYLMVMKNEHAARYLKFGGIENLGTTKYENLNQDSQILLWNPSQISKEFEEKILGKKIEVAA